MKQWQKIRTLGIVFLLITCSFIIWVVLQDPVQTWQTVVASILVITAFIFTFFNRQQEQVAKKTKLPKLDDIKQIEKSKKQPKLNQTKQPKKTRKTKKSSRD
ncbi:MAG: hypothetical protein ACOX0Z_03540 [Candidatus Nanosyncoccaceae bacterium]|jgi:DMSO/TMAO reductase YedYZ heme-binding membrane subunit